MSNEELLWRLPSRVAGFVGLTLSVVEVVWECKEVYQLLSQYLRLCSYDTLSNQDRGLIKAELTVYLIPAIYVLITSFIQACLNIPLIQNTSKKPSKDVLKPINATRNYQNLGVSLELMSKLMAFLVGRLYGSMGAEEVLYLVVSCFVRFTSFYIVHQFSGELEETLRQRVYEQQEENQMSWLQENEHFSVGHQRGVPYN